ncbi:hypothetical protein ACJIZ3_013452 [Penstemon smallii]|uniref:TLC domain-containing protein n=1 Tax=Penstemon smallii TaxID=265156 RepID=A0ABD3UQ80_9LAMI
MAGSRRILVFKNYQNQAELLVRSYLLSDPFIPYTSVIGGILACKLLYDLTQLISTFYFRSYNGLTKIQRSEWNNRGISTIHALFISTVSLYFVFWSDLFSDQNSTGLVTFRNSSLSTFALGISVGYFISDLGMICWLYPSLGGVEYIVHHSLSGIAVAYSMYTGEGQLYTFMVLISEVTTPEINMRWYLDTAGLKKSTAYLINGVVIFFAWLVSDSNPHFNSYCLFAKAFWHGILASASEKNKYKSSQKKQNKSCFWLLLPELLLSEVIKAAKSQNQDKSCFWLLLPEVLLSKAQVYVNKALIFGSYIFCVGKNAFSVL